MVFTFPMSRARSTSYGNLRRHGEVRTVRGKLKSRTGQWSVRDFSFPRIFVEGPSRGVSQGVAPINPRLNLTSDPVTPYHFPPPLEHNDEN